MLNPRQSGNRFNLDNGAGKQSANHGRAGRWRIRKALCIGSIGTLRKRRIGDERRDLDDIVEGAAALRQCALDVVDRLPGLCGNVVSGEAGTKCRFRAVRSETGIRLRAPRTKGSVRPPTDSWPPTICFAMRNSLRSCAGRVLAFLVRVHRRRRSGEPIRDADVHPEISPVCSRRAAFAIRRVPHARTRCWQVT